MGLLSDMSFCLLAASLEFCLLRGGLDTAYPPLSRTPSKTMTVNLQARVEPQWQGSRYQELLSARFKLMSGQANFSCTHPLV